jgi:hypothetical protein
MVVYFRVGVWVDIVLVLVQVQLFNINVKQQHYLQQKLRQQQVQQLQQCHRVKSKRFVEKIDSIVDPI